MLARMRKAIDEREEGFTLIELLVVIIIIGILAAIAIPVFLSQRQKGYDAQAKSDLRNVATLQETFLTDCNYYAGAVTSSGVTQTCTTGITSYKKSPNVTSMTVGKLYDSNAAAIAGTVSASTTTGVGGFCLQATSSSSSTKKFFYDNTKGGLQPSVTTTC